jgi:hypothetical protein
VTTFILIHGGLHGAWCWQSIAGPLRDAGHAVDAVGLPGRGGTDGADFEAYVQAVAAAVDCAEPVAPLMVPLRINHDGFGSVPKVYLGSRNDHVLPWWLQE